MLKPHMYHNFAGTPTKFCAASLTDPEGFNVDIWTLCREYVQDWAESEEAGKGMILAGPTGVGKSYAMAATLHGIHKHWSEHIPVSTMWFSASYSMTEMLDARQFGNKEKYNNLWSRLISVRLLAVDDLLHVSDYPLAKQLMASIYEKRDQAQLPTITTMNSTFSREDYGQAAQVFNEPFARKLLDNCSGFILST